MSQFVPRKGDFVRLSFDPQAGHEQKGRRPALVLSNDVFNRHTGMVIVCPLTNTNRHFPFHLEVPSSSSLTGFVMTEQANSVDYCQRGAVFIEAAPVDFVQRVQALLEACF